METTELSCFVISPIGDRHAAVGTTPREIWEQNIQIWEEVIQPACAGVGIMAVRADQISEAGDITDQIFRKLRDSHVVIADLTGANPNVMYELGLRHTTGKLTLQIGEHERLPFDVSTIRTIQFKRTPAGLVEARRTLVQAIAAGVEGRFNPIMATRVWLEAPEIALSPVSYLDQKSIDEEPGFLETLAEFASARAEMLSTSLATANVLREITEHTKNAIEQLKEANGAEAPIEKRIAVSNSLAKGIEDPAVRLESLTAAFAASLKRSDPGTKLIIEELKKKSDQGSKEQLGSMQELFRIMLEGLDSAQRYRDTITTGRIPTKAQGVQSKRIANALGIQIAVRPIIENWLRVSGD